MRRNLPNILSLSRLLLAPCVLIIPKRLLFPFLISVAFTDILDGFLARKFSASSRLGAILDPLADKVLALFCAFLFFSQGSLTPFSLFSLFSREISLLFFTVYLLFSHTWQKWSIQSFLCGKVATFLQTIVFSLLALDLRVPSALYMILLFFGGLSFFELVGKVMHKTESSTCKSVDLKKISG